MVLRCFRKEIVLAGFSAEAQAPMVVVRGTGCKEPKEQSRALSFMTLSQMAVVPISSEHEHEGVRRIRFVAPFPPVTCALSDIASTSERPNVNDTGLLYRPTPVAAISLWTP